MNRLLATFTAISLVGGAFAWWWVPAPKPPVNCVPEPASILALGGLAAAALKRKKKA